MWARLQDRFLNGKIEQRKVASSPLKLKPNADGPDLLEFQRAFLANEPALIPRSFGKAGK